MKRKKKYCKNKNKNKNKNENDNNKLLLTKEVSFRVSISQRSFTHKHNRTFIHTLTHKKHLSYSLSHYLHSSTK